MYETQWIRFCYKYKYIFPLSEPSIARPALTREALFSEEH